MQREKTWKERQIDRFRWDYGFHAELFADEHDDRRLLANIYNLIMEALQSLPDNPNNYVCCAMNHRFEEDKKIMDGILERYQNGLWGEPKVIHLREKLDRWPGIMRTTVAV